MYARVTAQKFLKFRPLIADMERHAEADRRSFAAAIAFVDGPHPNLIELRIALIHGEHIAAEMGVDRAAAAEALERVHMAEVREHEDYCTHYPDCTGSPPPRPVLPW